MNEICIRGLRVKTRIGVPDEERASEQVVEIDLTVVPQRSFCGMADDISATVDYAALATRVEELAAARVRHLLETLADECARVAVEEFGARSATVEIRKFILPETDHVAVRCRISRGEFPGESARRPDAVD